MYPLKFDIPYPHHSSRIHAVLRLLFGWLYIGIPHGICLLGLGILCMFAQFLGCLSILFSATYPKPLFRFVTGVKRWFFRVLTYAFGLTDQYPAFRLKQSSRDALHFSLMLPKHWSRGMLTLKVLFGPFYFVIPHLVMSCIHTLGLIGASLIACIVVIGTGTYPKKLFIYNRNVLNYLARTHTYYWQIDMMPPFTLKNWV